MNIIPIGCLFCICMSSLLCAGFILIACGSDKNNDKMVIAGAISIICFFIMMMATAINS